jgi:hypothetical protein
MTEADFEGLSIGTVVNVTGTFSSFLSGSAPAGTPATLEIDSPMITATAGTMTPVAMQVDASAIATDQYTATTVAPYEGNYVQVTGTSMHASSIAASEFQATCSDMSVPPQTNGTTYDGFDMTAGSSTLSVGFTYYDTVTYCLPCTGVAMPYACTNPVTASETFTGLSGIVEANWDSATMKVYLGISPTSDTDLTK